jgi:hypothetical protein
LYKKIKSKTEKKKQYEQMETHSKTHVGRLSCSAFGDWYATRLFPDDGMGSCGHLVVKRLETIGKKYKKERRTNDES